VGIIVRIIVWVIVWVIVWGRRLIVMRLVVMVRTLLSIHIFIPPLALFLDHMSWDIVFTPLSELTI
jgi:hypothetical protein